MVTRERGPLDALGSAIGGISRERAKWVENPDSGKPGEIRLGREDDGDGVPPPGKPVPQPAGPPVPGRSPSWPAPPDRDRGYREQNHLIPQRRPLEPIFVRKCSRGRPRSTVGPCRRRVLPMSPAWGRSDATQADVCRHVPRRQLRELRGVSIHPEKRTVNHGFGVSQTTTTGRPGRQIPPGKPTLPRRWNPGPGPRAGQRPPRSRPTRRPPAPRSSGPHQEPPSEPCRRSAVRWPRERRCRPGHRRTRRR